MTILHRVAGWAAICVALSVVGVGAAAGQQSGIKVRGHWIIDVYNPDGTRVWHTEFDNALVVSGGTTLSALLSRGNVPGAWAVELSMGPGVSGDPPCVGDGPCIVAESGWAPSSTPARGTVFKTLQVTSQTGGVTLAGTFTARTDRQSQIGTVRTLLAVCGSTVSPAACAAGPQNTGPIVTQHFLDPLTEAVNVGLGQIVQVTVEITFS